MTTDLEHYLGMVEDPHLQSCLESEIQKVLTTMLSMFVQEKQGRKGSRDYFRDRLGALVYTSLEAGKRLAQTPSPARFPHYIDGIDYLLDSVFDGPKVRKQKLKEVTSEMEGLWCLMESIVDVHNSIFPRPSKRDRGVEIALLPGRGHKYGAW